jgi:hypothetical protein
MRNTTLLDNGSVSTFPWQRIDADQMKCSRWWSIFGSPRSYKREATVTSSSVHHRVQKNSTTVKERDSPADKTFRTDSSEVTARAPDENKKTRLLFMCLSVKWIVVARSSKGQITPSGKPPSRSYLSRYQETRWQHLCIYLSVAYLKTLYIPSNDWLTVNNTKDTLERGRV